MNPLIGWHLPITKPQDARRHRQGQRILATP